MKCVILAAGRGLRLQRSDSKPLTSILGLPLIERVIRTARDGGATEFVVVTGYQAERVSNFVRTLADRLNLPITVENNELWDKRGNGHSLLVARPHLDGPFLLTMVDHLFEADVIRRLVQADCPEDGLVLATDSRLYNPLVNLSDVTRVKVDNTTGKLLAIGKQLADHEYNAFDTGLFLCTPALLDAIAESNENGDSSLSGGVRKLIERGRALSLDASNTFWIDVDDDDAFRQAEASLLSRNRGKSRDGPVSRYLNRPLSARLSRWLTYTSLTPNDISLLCFLMSVVAAGLMLMPYHFTLALGGLFAQAASILDGCDGEVARLKQQESDYGGWLDAVLDRYSDALLITALSIHAWQIGYDSAVTAGFLALTGTLVLSYTADKYDGLMREKLAGGFRLGRDVRLLMIAVCAVLNLPMAALWLIALIMNAEVIRRLLVCRD